MSLDDDFKSAQQRVKTLSSTPSNNQLLQLYSLYKQGTVGDASGKRPAMLDMKGRAKFDAWTKVTGIGKQDAMGQYVSLVDNLAKEIA